MTLKQPAPTRLHGDLPGILPYPARSDKSAAMWLNQQTLDAIRIMVEVAQRHPALCRASDIAEATGITIMNVQKTVHDLKTAGLLTTLRGRAGGVKLARAAHVILISEIVRALEPADCPMGFLPNATSEARLARLLFQAHRGFFQPLENAHLGEFVGGSIEAERLA